MDNVEKEKIIMKIKEDMNSLNKRAISQIEKYVRENKDSHASQVMQRLRRDLERLQNEIRQIRLSMPPFMVTIGDGSYIVYPVTDENKHLLDN